MITNLLAPMANSVPWYYIAAAILTGGALFSHGLTMVSRSWESELKFPEWFSVAAQGSSFVMSAVFGSIAGHIVWNWALGGMVALAGSVSSAAVLAVVRKKLNSL